MVRNRNVNGQERERSGTGTIRNGNDQERERSGTGTETELNGTGYVENETGTELNGTERNGTGTGTVRGERITVLLYLNEDIFVSNNTSFLFNNLSFLELKFRYKFNYEQVRITMVFVILRPNYEL